MTDRARAVGRFALLALVGVPGCIASNVLDADRRMVQGEAVRNWQPAPADLQLAGFYESTDVTGDVAASLRRVYYHFAADGTYTAAALIDEGGLLRFQTLSGTWALANGCLELDGAEPVPVAIAGDQVRFAAPGGALTLRRSNLQ